MLTSAVARRRVRFLVAAVMLALGVGSGGFSLNARFPGTVAYGANKPPVKTPRAKASPKPAPVKKSPARHDDPPVEDGPPPEPVVLPTKKVKMADGLTVTVDDYGDKYMGYDYRPPIFNNDWRQKTRVIHPLDPGIEIVFNSAQAKAERRFVYSSPIVDPVHEVLYFSAQDYTGDNSIIFRINGDGSGLRRIASGLFLVREMSVDPEREKLYYVASRGVHRMNTDGTNVEDVAPDLGEVGGLAVDPVDGDVYFCQYPNGSPRMFRCRGDGSERTLILTGREKCGIQLKIDPVDRRIWRVERGWRQIGSARLDGSGVTELLTGGQEHWGGSLFAFDVDSKQKKLYIYNSYMNIRRTNFDGSQPEELIYAGGGGPAIDSRHRWLYWGQGFFYDGGNPGLLIRRMRIPPPLVPVEKPAPPLITGFDAEQATPGVPLHVAGKSFTGLTRAAVVGIGTGEYHEVRHRVISDESVEIAVPKLKEACRTVSVILESPGGVTVTMPLSSRIYDTSQPKSGLIQHFDAWEKGPKFSLVVNPACEVCDIEHCVVYAAPKSWSDVSLQGESVVFLKNRSATAVSQAKHSVLFHEPFAVINQREKLPEDSKLIPVPAIRLSFLESLISYSVN